jgi:predicted CXXCH cytochrome family protein
VPTSALGRHLGVADIRVLPNRSLDIEAQMLVIDRNTVEDKSVEKQIESFLLQPSRQAALKSRPQPWGKSKYTAPENCGKCHAAVYRDWRGTKHASALSTLIAENRVIPDCLPCHSEEYRRTLKTTRRPSPSRPTGIECATCHAAVIPHGSKGPAAKRKVDPKVCIDCHNPERSPDFDEKLYLDRVSHRGAHEVRPAQPHHIGD